VTDALIFPPDASTHTWSPTDRCVLAIDPGIIGAYPYALLMPGAGGVPSSAGQWRVGRHWHAIWRDWGSRR
jgi:hypothetical protein